MSLTKVGFNRAAAGKLSVKRPVNRSAKQSENDWSVLHFLGLRPAIFPLKQPVKILLKTEDGKFCQSPFLIAAQYFWFQTVNAISWL